MCPPPRFHRVQCLGLYCLLCMLSRCPLLSVPMVVIIINTQMTRNCPKILLPRSFSLPRLALRRALMICFPGWTAVCERNKMTRFYQLTPGNCRNRTMVERKFLSSTTRSEVFRSLSWPDSVFAAAHQYYLPINFSGASKISSIRSHLSRNSTARLVSSMITSRLDYCSSILEGLPAEQIARLQKVENWAARLVMRKANRQHNVWSALIYILGS